jgi:RHS repeat-associated protein
LTDVKFKYIAEGIKKGSLVLPPVADGVGNNPDLFKQALTYGSVDTRTGAAPQYNGNISTTTWQVAGRAKQTYAFTYDDLDRLLNAKYMDVTDTYNGSNGQWNSTYGAENKFEEKQTYDLRGNITSIERNGLNSGTWTNGKEGFTAATYGKIDNLQFQYYNGNKLVRVAESSLPDRGYKTTISPSNGSWQYGYDANGNLRFDFNKGITAIWYNHLNLPTLVYFSNGRSITFNYTADGELVRKNTWDPTNNTGYWMEYVNGIEYKNQILNRLAHPEGSVILNSTGSYELEYTLKDHLGNNRVVFRDKDNDRIIDTSDIKQINHTYPFGMDMEGNWNGSFMGSGTQGNAYKYNGKEFNNDYGLNWYHHDWRFYDVAINRFVTIDPESEEDEQESWTPYHFGLNNPIRYDDPDGRNPIIGAIIGAVTQTIEIAIDDNKSFSKDFSLKSVGISALAGASGAGLASKLGKVGKLAKLGIETAHDFTVSAASDLVKDGKVNLKKSLVDATIGKAAGDIAGNAALKAAAKTPQGKVLKKAVDRAEKIAAKSNRPGRVNKVERANNQLNNYVVKRSTSASVSASGAAGNAANKVLKTEKKEQK